MGKSWDFPKGSFEASVLARFSKSHKKTPLGTK
jgi:hypothetical protein